MNWIWMHSRGDEGAEVWKRQFAQYRSAGIEGVLTLVHNGTQALSAAVFATPELARTYVRQDWPSWDLDAAFPMIYHPYYAKPAMWIETATREGVDEIGGKFPLYSGLFVGAIEAGDLPRAVERAADAGAAGVCLFSHGAMTDAHWRALTQIKM